MTAPATPAAESRTPWREGVLNVTLQVSTYLGVAACVPSVYMAARTGLAGLAAFDIVMLATVFVLYRSPRMSYVWRAGVFCAVGYALGLALLLAVGTFSQIFFVASAVMTTLLLGMRAGLVMTVASSLTIGIIGLLGFTGPEVILVTKQFYATRWLVVAMNFLLVSSGLTLGIGTVVTRLEEALLREIRSRRSLEEERSVLRTFIDTLPDVVFVKDTEGRFILVNNATVQEFGFSRQEEMQGKSVFDIYPAAIAARLHSDDVAVMAGHTVINREVPSIGRDGKPRWFLTLKAPLKDSVGTVTGLIGVSRNITERKELEEQLRQAQKMEAVGQLAGGIAHDFNNLLTIIFGYSDVLRAETASNEEIREPVEAISDAASRAAALTRQLLAFSRQSMLQPKVLDLNATITDTGRMLSRLIGEDIEFTLMLAPEIAPVRVDPGQLDQVLMNLAVNARDAMPNGGTLTISTAQVELSESRAESLGTAPGAHVRVSVRDSGIGMSPEVVARIFEPFYTTKGLGIGTGLGLAMVFGIVRQSGGGIYVESAPDAGATFHILFPVVARAQAVPTAATESGSVWGSETILLVEDDAGVRGLAEANLRSFGYEVLTAVDGRDALAVLRAHATSIDILVTDVVMPNVSGPELASAVQADHPDIRVLFMSGYTDDAVVRQGLLKADVAFLQKPYTPLGLAQKVRQTLDVSPPAPV